MRHHQPERAQIPSWVGLWWVHAGIAAFAVALVVSHYGWRYTLSRHKGAAPTFDSR